MKVKMRKQLITAAILSCAGISLSSHAATLAESAYVSAKVGGSSLSNYDNHSRFSYTNSATSTTTTDSAVKLSDDKKTVFTGNIAYGVNFDPAYHVPARAEFEYGYHKATLNSAVSGTVFNSPVTSAALYSIKDKQDLTLQTFMLNGYYDFKNSSRFTPYISAGAGLAYTELTTSTQMTGNVTVENNSASSKKTHFAWAVGAGVSYELTPRLSLDLTYRYLNAGKTSTTNHYKTDVSTTDSSDTTTTRTDYLNKENKVKVDAHDLTFGLRYSF